MARRIRLKYPGAVYHVIRPGAAGVLYDDQRYTFQQIVKAVREAIGGDRRKSGAQTEPAEP